MTFQINEITKGSNQESVQEVFVNKEINFNVYTRYLNKYVEA